MTEILVRGNRIFAANGGMDFTPSRPAVVLVHGAGMDHSVWALQSRALAHCGHSVLAVDLPGHGRSEGEALTSIAAIADWLAEFIAIAGLDSAVVAMITAWGFSPAAAMGGNPAPGLWLTGGGRRLLECSKPGVLHADLVACNAYGNGEAAAAQIRCPALVVAGGADRMSPAKAGRALAALIPGGKVERLEGAGHMLMAERPQQVLKALRDYSAGIG